jgi:hypothetical protein
MSALPESVHGESAVRSGIAHKGNSANNEYRAVCMLDQFVADAPHQKAAEVGKTTRANHDQVRLGFFSSAQDLGGNPAR